jgi:hypothetical protein
MVQLIPPKVAIRIVQEFERKSPSVWHLRSSSREYLTPCQIIHTQSAMREWEEKPLEEIKSATRFCAICLGAMEVTK